MEEMKITMPGNRILTRKELFKRKEEFHKEQANLPFEEKIRILVQLQKMAKNIKKKSGQTIWKIF